MLAQLALTVGDGVGVAACRHQLSLFAHISNITWNFDQKDRMAGVMSNNKTGDIKQFALDPASTNQFDIVNQLWDYI
jgi:kinetochore protein Spc24